MCHENLCSPVMLLIFQIYLYDVEGKVKVIELEKMASGRSSQDKLVK